MSEQKTFDTLACGLTVREYWQGCTDECDGAVDALNKYSRPFINFRNTFGWVEYEMPITLFDAYIIELQADFNWLNVEHTISGAKATIRYVEF